MESSLKRVLDYKLVFDLLADRNGMVKLGTLTSMWPAELAAPTTLPRSCVKFWSEYANAEGYLDWERFSGGLEKAMKADSLRLSKGRRTPLPSEAEQTLQALQRREAPSHVKAGEIEQFLASCGGDALMQALARTRKEVYNCQRSLHTLTVPATSSTPGRKSSVSQVRRWSSMGSADIAISAGGGSRTPSSPIKGNRSVSIASEKEELLRGMEVMKRTQKWYQDRMEQLSLEEKQMAGSSYTHEMRAEELLAALEPGSQSSETRRHLQEINAHLISLALQTPVVPTAGSPTKPSAVGQGSPTKPLAVQGQGSPIKPLAVQGQGSPIKLLAVQSQGSPTKHGQLPQQTTRKSPSRSLSMNTPLLDQYSYSSPTGRHKPKRSLSLKGSLATACPPVLPQQYPLRETFSMRELPHQQHPHAVTHQQGLRETSSMRNIPTHLQSPPAHVYTRTQQRDDLPLRARGPWQTADTETNATAAEKGRTKRKLSKTVKEQTARIHKLEAEKALLVQQMFQKNATVHFPADDSILSLL